MSGNHRNDKSKSIALGEGVTITIISNMRSQYIRPLQLSFNCFEDGRRYKKYLETIDVDLN